MSVALLVLNYNGRSLLEACLPTVVRAAERSRHDCRVIVIDNSSRDDSREFLARAFPRVECVVEPNLGLCSFNAVLARLDCRVAVLLNNDIKLAEESIDPLVAPLLEPREAATVAPLGRCFMTAPRCYLFDGTTYEGFKTAVRWRFGLLQATSLFPGCQQGIERPGLTAAAGAALAVDRQVFLELGGFDPLYLPGRIEDLDLCYRAFVAGYHARYVPEAVAYHQGQASFGPEFTAAGCDHLALRNTLLFQWKNLRRPGQRMRQFAGQALRWARELAGAPLRPRGKRLPFLAAWREAKSLRRNIAHPPQTKESRLRERQFFAWFHPRRIHDTAALASQPTEQARSRSLRAPQPSNDSLQLAIDRP